MKKILGILSGAFSYINCICVMAAEKFDILPDLPEPLAAAQASSVTVTSDAQTPLALSQSIGHEPNLISVTFSLIFVVLLIYATGIIYSKLNKLGLNTMKKQMGEANSSKVAVISTTPLGNNKTLHVVELDGKRMLIGASSSSIDLIKDLGSYPPVEVNENAYSKIEIPNIRIPKIEIPKIEFPNIGFTKVVKKQNDNETENNIDAKDENFEISDIYEEPNPDGIIDELFKTDTVDDVKIKNTEPVQKQQNTHTVDPDEYALYKKYL